MAGNSTTELREPGFLFWLGQFVGTWKLGAEALVQRRDDGFLEARLIEGSRQVPLASALGIGGFVKAAEGPLGPRPVKLSHSLMRHWLTAEEMARLRNAWRVGVGMRLIAEAIEQRMAAMNQSEREARWLEWWAAGALSLEPLSAPELTGHQALYRRFRAGERTTRPVPLQGCSDERVARNSRWTTV